MSSFVHQVYLRDCTFSRKMPSVLWALFTPSGVDGLQYLILVHWSISSYYLHFPCWDSSTVTLLCPSMCLLFQSIVIAPHFHLSLLSHLILSCLILGLPRGLWWVWWLYTPPHLKSALLTFPGEIFTFLSQHGWDSHGFLEYKGVTPLKRTKVNLVFRQVLACNLWPTRNQSHKGYFELPKILLAGPCLSFHSHLLLTKYERSDTQVYRCSQIFLCCVYCGKICFYTL